MRECDSNNHLVQRLYSTVKSLNMNKRKCEIGDIYELEKYFKNYRIMLFDDLYKFTKMPK